jgi:nickel-dependent lactate racemase
MTREERQFFRGGALARVPVAEHDCDDASQLSALLFTRRGTPVRVNRKVRDADLVILLSPVTFHYFAGFGGGRKLILPGCAWRPSILANHRLSLTDESPVGLHRACRPGNLEGNPVHEDMCEAAGALDNLFGVNYITDSEGRVAWVNAGEPLAAHTEACAAYAARHRVTVPAPAAVIVASAGGTPHDINLLQAHKALYHACAMAGEGSSVLFYAACGEGIGSESLAAALAAPRDKFLARAREDYALNNQAAVSLLGLTRRFRVGMVTELEPEVLESAGITPVENAEAFIAGSLDAHGAGAVTVIRSGARTLPSISGRKDN